METYKTMKERHQTEVNALPLAFAFSDRQYLDKLAAWNITPAEAEAGAVVGIGGAGFIRAEDRELVFNTFARHQAETAAAIAGDLDGTGFIYEMFLTELNNHEYSYTRDLSETLAALDLTVDDVNNNKALANGLYNAVKDIEAAADPFDE